MTEAPQNGVERLLGTLIGRFDGFEKRLDQADKSRARMHVRVDEMAVNVTAFGGEVQRLIERLRGTEQAIDRFKKYEAGGQAAVSVITVLGRPISRAARWLGGLVVLGVVAFWRELKSAILGG